MTGETIKQLMDAWLDVQLKATNERMKLRDMCPHERQARSMSDQSGELLTLIFCVDCGKTLGEE